MADYSILRPVQIQSPDIGNALATATALRGAEARERALALQERRLAAEAAERPVKLGLQIQEALARMDESQRAKVKDQVEQQARLLAFVDAAADPDKEDAYQMALGEAKRLGLPTEGAPPKYSKGWVGFQIARAQSITDILGKSTPIQVSKGATLYDPRSKQAVFTAPDPEAAGGPFKGNALDAQAMNMLLKGDPSSADYRAAYNHLAAERVDIQSGARVKPDMSAYRPPSGAGAAAPPPSGATVTPGTTRPLSETARTNLAEAGGTAQAMQTILSTFQDTYGGYGHGAVGDIDMFIKRNITGDKSGEAQWWQTYQDQKNIIRNKLFGSALTATEKGEFEKANVNPGMRPEQIRENLARQSEIAKRAARKTAQSLAADGYNVKAIEAATGYSMDELAQPAQGAAVPGGRSQSLKASDHPEGTIANDPQGRPAFEVRGGKWVPYQPR